jgi:hypothetical protein
MATEEISDEEARALGLMPDEISDAEAASLGIRPKTSKTDTAILHGGSGVLGGFLDEAGGAIAAGLDKLGLWNTGDVPIATTKDGVPLANNQQKGSVYSEVRDGIREDLKNTAEDHGGIATTANIVGSVLSPTGKLKALGAGAKGLKAAVTAGAKQGALASLGESEADLTEGEAGGALLDTAIGFGAGGVFGGAGALLTKGAQKGRDAYRVYKGQKALKTENLERAAEGMAPLAPKTSGQILDEAHEAGTKRAKEDLTQKVLNEVAEGDTGKLTTPTNAKKLDKAGEAIVDEVTAQPDARVVRSAILDRAKSGRETLGKVTNKVKQRNDDNYALFESAKKNVIDAEDYAKGLEDEIQKASDAGRKEDADMLRVVKKDFEDLWADTTGGNVTLKALRQWTTDVQSKAASSIGSLHPHDLARRRARIAGIVTEDMSDTLKKAAAGDQVLVEAAERISKNNKRLHGLLTVDAALAARQWKEQTERSTSQKVAEALAGGGVAAAGGALLGNDEDRAMTAAGLGVIGLGGGLGARRFAGTVGRAVQRGQTTAAIEAAKKAADVGRRATQDEVAARAGTAVARAGAAATPDLGPLTDSQLMQELRRAAQEKDSDRSQEIIAEIGRRKRN